MLASVVNKYDICIINNNGGRNIATKNKTMTYSEAANSNVILINEGNKTIQQFNSNLNQWESWGWSEAGVRSQDGGHDEEYMIYEDAVIAMEYWQDELGDVSFMNEDDIEAGK